MNKRGLFMLVVSVAAGACRTPVPVAHPPAAPGSELTFFVRAAGQLPLQDLSGVRVAGIATDGARVEFGRTWGGKLTIRKDRLRSQLIQMLIFCLEGFHCSAYDLASEENEHRNPSLLEYDEWSVDLAPFVLYD
jgi:hypothetical protein